MIRLALVFSVSYLFLFQTVISAEVVRNLQSQCDSCRSPLPFDPTRHKLNYKVGVLSIRGVESAYAQHNETFSSYLTATAGHRFDPPISFEMVPLAFQEAFDVAEEGSIDFVYVNPSLFACLEAEHGAQSLVSQISRRVVGGQVYELEKFGGLIIARADDEGINKIQDLKNKVIGAASIAALGAGQMQYREMQKAGLSYVEDPKQLVFTSNQGAIVKGVLSGEFDAGFVRTDQIERTFDVDGNPVDSSLLKVLQPRDNHINGELFPFTASTQLYPEWNLAAMPFVPADVSAEVQAAMLSLLEFSEVGSEIEKCAEAALGDSQNCTISTLAPDARCDTTSEIALAAHIAMTNGEYAEFRTTQSYTDIRNMLQETNFIRQEEETGTWRCARPKELYEAIVCPVGHFKKSKEEVESGCSDSGLECKEGYQCVCNPCVKAFDVDVFPAEEIESGAGSGSGCSKMSLCGVTQQTKTLEFHAVDNKKREGATMTVSAHEGASVNEIEVVRGTDPYTYSFSVSSRYKGIVVLEIKIDGEQIPESPLRVEIEERDCSEDFAFDLHVATEDGTCVCASNSASFGTSCVPFSILFSAIFVPLAVVIAVAVGMYVRKKTRDADSVWYVKRSDLKFKCPPDVIGQGSFGLVLLGEYRGTKVAVKRALPPCEDSQIDQPHKSSKIKSVSSCMFNSTRLVTPPMDADNMKRAELGEGVSKTGLDVLVEDDNTFSNTDEGTDPGDEEMGAVPARKASLQVTENLQAKYSGHSTQSGSLKDSSGDTVKFGNLAHGRLSMTSGHAATAGTASTSVAVKKKWLSAFLFVKKSSGSSAEAKHNFIKEMRLLAKLRHPCITTVMGAVIDKGEDPLLVMEYMEHGSLYDIIHNESMFIDGVMMLHILRDISQGIRFLHGADPPVIHGDLKSSNILVDSKFRAKVCDFGLSRRTGDGARGTPYWMAPELLRGESGNTTASDMYSLGIVLHELYSRKDPYEGEHFKEVLRLVADKRVNKRPMIPDSCPPKVGKFIKFLLLSEPATRPTAAVLDNRINDLVEVDVMPCQTLSHQSKRTKSLKEGSTDFLYQLFPRHIADVLQRGGKVEPESHESVTIFFSDIIGFTEIASTVEPMKISNMLDRLYTGFDELARKHNLFKIETVGDAYMCAGNLANNNQETDHVKRVAQFAIEAVNMASKTMIDEDDPNHGYVQIRTGFHTGPVVSNVVGSLNPRYGVFGDTVNVSSRMEGASEPGRILCSEHSANLLIKQAPKIPLKRRGPTTIKGKGKIVTYWVG